MGEHVEELLSKKMAEDFAYGLGEAFLVHYDPEKPCRSVLVTTAASLSR
jgi:hypothetical protein